MSQQFQDILGDRLHFVSPQLSFCTHFSWFGVAKSDRLGVEAIHLFYNRACKLLSPNLLTFRLETPEGGRERQASRSDQTLCIEETDGRGFACKTAFADTDVLCCAASLDASSRATAVKAILLLPASEPAFGRTLTIDSTGRRIKIETRLPQPDNREPDPDHPLTLYVIAPDAFRVSEMIANGVQTEAAAGAEVETDGSLVLRFAADSEDLVGAEQSFVIGIGEGPTADHIVDRVHANVSYTLSAALSSSAKWFSDALDSFTTDGVPKRYRSDYALAAYQILSNTKAPRGQFGRHVAFPSRGTYAAHYLWDSCFTNLGASQFSERLAEDYLIALCECQEEDGKIPQFACATWNRPGESQPPLVAWSAWMLYEKFGNKELIRAVYDPLCRMVEWWFANRDSDQDGLVEYQHALESGWDDSPRFDQGRVAGIDLNAYLNREMRLLAKMAPVLARDHESDGWLRRADEHEKLIHSRLLDREDGLYYDRLVEEDRLHKVLTPACFMPLWAGLAVPRETAHRMIANYLVNPQHFFGSKPFPSVAYSDPNYEPGEWWRGPVWPNIAWTMTEILRMYGFEREWKTAVHRLVEMITLHPEPNELYNSATGNPIGAAGLGWTCGVLMDLLRKW